MNTPFSLNGQAALVTGGGTGIGKAIATCMAASGARVVICGRRQDVLEEACRQMGERASFVVHDVAQSDRAEALIETVTQQAGAPTILVNCAGIHLKKTLTQTTDAELLNLLNIHLVGAYALTRAVIAPMKQQGGGSILFISSMAAVFGIPLVSAYAAAKSALLGVVRTLAAEVSCDGIRVNAIAPGWIESDMTKNVMKDDPERFARILQRTPMGRFGVPEDIGWGAVYLASPAAKFITGQQLVIDGGVSIGF
jgi:NAD(P)-dependent dehydrogenase (short-subunit alcohol dehydrogenase family)